MPCAQTNSKRADINHFVRPKMRETWFVLEDGRAVDPAEVWTDEAGRLMHADGPIAMRSPDCPMSRGVDPEEERSRYTTREMKPEAPKRGYKTRRVV
jgi:hypothetical protein